MWSSRKAESSKRQGGVVDTAESVGKQNEVKERLKKCVQFFLRANESQLCVNDAGKCVRDIIRWSSDFLDA